MRRTGSENHRGEHLSRWWRVAFTILSEECEQPLPEVPLAKMLTICMLGNFTVFFNKDWHYNVHSFEIQVKAE